MTKATIEELIADSSCVYTREQFDADYKRVVTRICEKHGIAYGEVGAFIREHHYVHDAEDIEQEYIEAVAFARHAGWSPKCPRCSQHFTGSPMTGCQPDKHGWNIETTPSEGVIIRGR